MIGESNFSEKKGWILLYVVLFLLLINITLGQYLRASDLEVGSVDISPIKKASAWLIGICFIGTGWIVLNMWNKYLTEEKESGRMTRERESALIIKTLVYLVLFVILLVAVIRWDVGKIIYQFTST